MTDKLICRVFQPGDQFLIEARDDFDQAFADAGFQLPQGPTWTLTHDGRPLVCGGVALIDGRDGEWEAWAFAADMTPRQWLRAARHAITVLAYIRRAFLVRKIHATAANGEKGARLLTLMGFAPTDGFNDMGQEFVLEIA